MLDLLVIGGGPAGVAGAVQAHRSGLKTLLVERERIGGLIRNANLVENHPGLPRPLEGPAVAELLRQQLERSGVPQEAAEITALRRGGEFIHAETGALTIPARAVLLATGSRPRPLPLPGEEEVRQAGLLHYEVSHLPCLDHDSEVLIVGGGDAAFDYALNCARQGARATVLFRGDEPRCLPLLLERAAASPAIRILGSTRPLRVLCSEDGRAGLACRRDGAGGEKELAADFLLAAVGREPDAGLAEGLDPARPGCYDDGPGGGSASPPKIYLAGDAAHGRFRQMAIAAGEGMLAAMHAAARLDRANR
jgi:thioredoxin reductase (NADPH)